MDKRICIHCGGSLKIIGTHRKNGRDIFLVDWSKREYHKKCFKVVKQLEKYKKIDQF
jgi:hypothetical protein